MRTARCLAVSTVTGCAALLAESALADCALWAFTEPLRLVQSNGPVVSMTLHREAGTTLVGSAAWSGQKQEDEGPVSTGDNGIVRGTNEGSDFHVEIEWGAGSVGVYSGRIDSQGNLAGTTFDRAHPGARADWSSTSGLRQCVAVQSSRPVRQLGKRRPPIPAQVQPSPASTARAAEGNDICVSGFVWRAARPEDLVCVSPVSRATVWQENGSAAQRWDPAGAYGPKTCVSGYVWREAFEGDVTCVTPQRRDEVREENSFAASRRVGG